MLLGLHSQPLAITAGVGTLLVLAALGFVAANRQSPEFAGILAMPLVAAALVIAGVSAVIVASQEHSLDARDSVIRSRLQTGNIEIVGWRNWDREVVVRNKGGCTAVFTVQSGDLGANARVWPLVSGTAQVVSGCQNVNVEKTFGSR